ncbi:glycerol-3-phosphate 1-O-acyltransferase PlsY [Thermovenabulum sp.]|uniref:glycerol-3-phosphate 1-O-acyltransferase PlsY n=1 Tax=Thermovenabulum sp. TaxID=3100335 RepID=UPI003C7C9C2F
MLKYIVFALLSYLFGSISFAYIICKKYYGIDIRKYGSGNPGTTNVLRTVGTRAAALVYIADFLKGFLAVMIGRLFGGPIFGVFCGLFAIIGHDFSLFLGFNGGKGIATSMGVGFAVSPLAALLSTLAGVAVIFLTRYVSLGSITGITLFPIFLGILGYKNLYIFYALIMAIIAVYRHKSNIKRLLEGKENKLGQKN